MRGKLPMGFVVQNGEVESNAVPNPIALPQGFQISSEKPTAQPQEPYVDKIPAGAMPMALEDLAIQSGELDVDPLGTVAKTVLKESPEIAGSVFGGIEGFNIGRRFGTPAAVGGSIVGSILGSTGGKEVSQGLGIKEDQTLSQNILESTKEELVGRGILTGLGVASKVAAPVVSPVVNKAKSLFGIEAEKPIEDLFLSSSIFDPSLNNPRSIIDAQENILNKRMLTTFEETGGKADAQRMEKLAKRVMESRKYLDSQSNFLANREVINDKLRKALSPKQGFDRVDLAMSDSVKDSFNAALKSFAPKFKSIENELIASRKAATLPVGDTPKLIESQRELLNQKLGRKQADVLIKTINSQLGKPRVSLADLKEIDNSIDNLLPKFSESKDVQSKIAGVYSSSIKPLLRDMKTQALVKEPQNSALEKGLSLEAQFAELAEQRGAILNSRIGKALGLSENVQIKKGVKPSALAGKVFESPQTWEETKTILQLVNPQLIAPLEQAYKIKTLSKITNKNGDVTLSGLKKVLEDERDLVLSVGGEQYLKALEDSRLITAALETTKNIADSAFKASTQEKILTNMGRVLINPLTPKYPLFSGIMTKAKKGIGLGDVSDRDLFNTMRGERGQEMLSKLTGTFMDDPKAYNTYLQFVRELNRINNAEVKPVDRETFEAELGSVMIDVQAALKEFGNKEE